MREPRQRADAPACKHLFLGADVEDALEVDEAADEVGYAPYRLAVDDRDLASARVDGVDRDVGRRFRAAEHHHLAPSGERGIVIARGVQDLPALRLEGVFAWKAQRLRFVELSGADHDEVE